jgi:signal transduction histidine kinase
VNRDPRSQPILILAPLGKDAEMVTVALERAELQPEVCADLFELADRLNQDTGAMVIAQEALSMDGMERLLHVLDAQPLWSDIPIIMLTSGGEDRQATLRTLDVFGPAGNVTLLERPLRRVTLVSSVQVALRSRRRQYGMRALLETEQQARRELEATVNELERFSYTVSHDLRAPLRSIDAYCAILSEKIGEHLKPEFRRYFDSVRTNVTRMGQLIDDVLRMTRLSRTQMAVDLVDVNDVVRDVLETVVPAERGRRIEMVVDDLPPCRCDRAMLAQLYTNLLSNALKFTRKREDARIEIGSRREQGVTVYYVKDNGVGFRMEHSDKLFRMFERLHRTDEFDGTGVGLAIVQQVVARHGGKAWAEGSPGEGAAFYFTLKPHVERRQKPQSAAVGAAK